ncbi:hypothetical protein IWQ60_001093 [Tieghemiomyces parasiticus]|uniref:YEATS domain-containing protein n=1 Tax=Tieghemiomyces parasiticus TaxID=78921 RepID=A0A9W8AHC1_9FUNG|nr:hypothetical protein IWQ60_001093 [Tieghemiomyces parasiticus]
MRATPCRHAHSVYQQLPGREDFDLEIHLKQREILTIQEELARGRRSLEELDAWAKDGSVPAPYAALQKAPAAPAHTSSARPTRPIITAHLRPERPAKRTRKDPGNHILVIRRADGSEAQIVCPLCQRYHFINLQGFLNHSRISHDAQYASHEEAVRLCGIPYDPATIGAGIEVNIDTLKPNWLAASANFAVPAALPTGQSRSSALLNSAALNESQRSQLSSTLDFLNQKPSIKVYEEDVDLGSGSDADVTPSRPVPSTSECNGVDLPYKSPHLTSGHGTHEHLPSNGLVAPSSPAHDTDADLDELDRLTEDRRQIPTVPAAPAWVPLPQFQGRGQIRHGESRFYLAKRVLVGNVSKYLAPSQRPAAHQDCGYRWMIYVTTPGGHDPLSTFVSRIQVFLHPSYRPHDVVDLTGPKFQLTRYGWGEFPLKLKLYFVDPRNKPVDLIHNLDLDKSLSGRQVPGREQIIDLELDRNTVFAPVAVNAPFQRETAALPARPRPTRSLAPPDPFSPLGLPTMVYPWLWVAADWYPVILAPAARSRWEMDYPLRLPYTTAEDEAQYWRWSLGKRKAVEWRRARCIREFLRQSAWQPKLTRRKPIKYAALFRARPDGSGLEENVAHLPELATAEVPTQPSALAEQVPPAMVPDPKQPSDLHPPSPLAPSGTVAESEDLRPTVFRLNRRHHRKHQRIEEDQRQCVSDISTGTILRWCRIAGLVPTLAPPGAVVTVPELLRRAREDEPGAVQPTARERADAPRGPLPPSHPGGPKSSAWPSTDLTYRADGTVVTHLTDIQAPVEDDNDVVDVDYVESQPILYRHCRLCGIAITVDRLGEHLRSRGCVDISRLFPRAQPPPYKVGQVARDSEWYEWYGRSLVTPEGIPHSLTPAASLTRHCQSVAELNGDSMKNNGTPGPSGAAETALSLSGGDDAQAPVLAHLAATIRSQPTLQRLLRAYLGRACLTDVLRYYADVPSSALTTLERCLFQTGAISKLVAGGEDSLDAAWLTSGAVPQEIAYLPFLLHATFSDYIWSTVRVLGLPGVPAEAQAGASAEVGPANPPESTAQVSDSVEKLAEKVPPESLPTLVTPSALANMNSPLAVPTDRQEC